MLGTSKFTTTFRGGRAFEAVRFCGKTLVGFEKSEDRLLLNLLLVDVMLNPILRIEQSEVVINTGIRDFTYNGPEMTISPKFSKPLVFRQEASALQIKTGFFFGPGRTLEVRPDAIILEPGRNRLSSVSTYDCMTGIDCS